MLKTSQLEIFAAVIDCGSLVRAAEYLNTSQPYLSRVLKSMEDELGKTLLVRGKQGVQPTRDGKFIYGYAKTIIQNLEKIEEFKNIDLSTTEMNLSVSLYSFFVDKDVFLEFARNNMSNKISINIREDNLTKLFENVLSGNSGLGIGVINDIEFPAVQSAAISQNIRYEILDVSPLYVHMGSRQRAYEKEDIYMEDLLYSTYIHTPFDKYSRARLEIEIDGYKMKEFKQTMAVNHYALIIYMLQQTDSFIFGNKWQKITMNRMGLKSREVKNTDIRMHLVMFYKNEIETNEVKKFKELFSAEYLI